MEIDEFRKQVKDALEHLYDTAYLETHPLLSQFPSQPATNRLTRAQQLRSLLKETIEALRPQDRSPSQAPERRSYLALRYHYVQGMSSGETENELGISLRQLQRELHKGLDAVAAILWEKQSPPDVVPTLKEMGELEKELNQWTLARASWNLRALVEETLSTLKPRIESRHIDITIQIPADLPKVFVDATLTRQALLNVLRLAVNQAHDRIVVSAGVQEKIVGMVIIVEGVIVDWQTEDWRNAELLLKAQGGILDLNTLGQITILLPRTTQSRVLVIDDNAAIHQLFERYLAPHQYEIIHANNGTQALELAMAQRPDAITLDVMMPNVDGWQVLRGLAGNPTTANIPVIICSVLKEPDLAYSLGARVYLKKPVERLDLVTTLARVLSSANPAAASHRSTPEDN